MWPGLFLLRRVKCNGDKLKERLSNKNESGLDDLGKLSAYPDYKNSKIKEIYCEERVS
jgi:hypothetical protein